MNQKLEEKIKDQLKNQKPKSKWYFISRSLLKDLILFLLWLFLVIVIGFVTNIFLELGSMGFKVGERIPVFGLLSMVPFELLFIVAVLTFLIYLLFKNIGFLYRLNIWLVCTIIVVTVLFGFVVAENTGLNRAIINSSVGENLFHRQGRFLTSRSAEIVGGNIVSISGEEMKIRIPSGSIWTIIISDNTEFPDGGFFVAGDRIWVLGDKKGDKIEAEVIHKLRNQPRQGPMRGKRIFQSTSDYQLYGTNLN
jgi:hypothetical protein